MDINWNYFADGAVIELYNEDQSFEHIIFNNFKAHMTLAKFRQIIEVAVHDGIKKQIIQEYVNRDNCMDIIRYFANIDQKKLINYIEL